MIGFRSNIANAIVLLLQNLAERLAREALSIASLFFRFAPAGNEIKLFVGGADLYFAFYAGLFRLNVHAERQHIAKRRRITYIMKKEEPLAPATKFTSHSATVTDRKKLAMTGVAKVDGATDGEIVLTTALGRLVVTGSELKIAKFDDTDGNLTLGGNIDAIKYTANKLPLVKRIFK